MFKDVLQTDFFQLASDKASNGIIKEDREKYAVIFDEVRKVLANDDKIIISDINVLLNKKHINTQESMSIYTIYTRRTTTLITNTIHKNIGKLVQMKEIIPIEEYEILYNMRRLISVYHIDKYKNVNIPSLFNAVKIDTLYYFSPEIEIMNIYHKLYSPIQYDNWPLLIKKEKILYDKLLDNMIGGVSCNDISGKSNKGFQDINLYNGGAKCTDCKSQRKLDINNIKILLLNFLNNENYIMIGKWAHNLINSKKDISNDYNIQIISENDIEHDYRNIANFLSSYTNYGIYYKKKKLYVPQDNRLYKYTLFIKYPVIGKTSSGIDKQFIDIYNCASYELIPCIPKKHDNLIINVGNLFVQLRFLLIDLWLIRLLKYLKIVGSTQFTYKNSDIYTSIKLLKDKMPPNFKDKYIGIHYDEKIEQKIVISKKQIKKNSYYPELSITKDKKYRIIATSS
jgi:hypothetical protein